MEGCPRHPDEDVLLISKQNKCSENSAWYQDASRMVDILVCSTDLSVGDFLESDAGFIWMEVAVVRLYTVRRVRQKVVAACDYSMPCRKRRQAKATMYW